MCAQRIARSRLVWVVFVSLLLGVGTPLAVHAADIYVNSTNDTTVAGDKLCTLREAVNNANTNSDTTKGDCTAGTLVPMDIIHLPAGIYRLQPGLDDTNLKGDLDLLAAGGSVRLQGTLSSTTVISTSGYVVGVDRLLHLAPDGPAGVSMEVHDVTLRGGHTGQGGGAVMVNGVNFLVEDCLLIQNDATFAGGMSYNGNGGAFYNNGGSGIIRRSLLADNKSRGGVVAAVAGGAIYATGASGHLSVEFSQLLRNQVAAIGGTGGRADGGAIFVDGAYFEIYRSSVLSSTAAAQGTPKGNGGGLYVRNSTYYVTDSLIAGSRADEAGGGIYEEGSQGEISGSTLAGNRAGTDGGGIAGSGAGTLVNSTLSANQAAVTGGGLRVTGSGDYALTNVTITDNTGDSSSDPTGHTGGVAATGFRVSLRSTLIAGNHDNNPFVGARTPDVSGGFTTLYYNLIGDGTGSGGLIDGLGGDMVGTSTNPVAALLLPLGDYGGLTPTHAPLWQSLAINHGDPATYPPTDQRGVARPQYTVTDIGAVEVKGYFVPFAARS